MQTYKIARQCSRCPREEERVVTLQEMVETAKKPEVKTVTALEVTLDGQKIASYAVLCATCRKVVEGYCEHVGKRHKKSSQRRRKG